MTSTSDCGCVWERTEEHGDTITAPCAEHAGVYEFVRVFDERMEHYAVRAMDIELDHVVRAKRTIACKPSPAEVADALRKAWSER